MPTIAVSARKRDKATVLASVQAMTAPEREGTMEMGRSGYLFFDNYILYRNTTLKPTKFFGLMQTKNVAHVP